MTSNAGSSIREGALGFGKDKNTASADRALKALNEFLRPEFVGRVDEIIVFNSLTKEDYVKIAKLLIDELVPSLRDKGIKLSYDESVPETIADGAVGGVRGARDLRNAIRRQIEDRITNILIDNRHMNISDITLISDNGEIKADFK